VLGVVAAGAFLLLATVLLVGGIGLAVSSAVIRDDDGLVRSTPATWSTAGYAVRSDTVRFHATGMMGDASQQMMGTVEVQADGLDGRDVFVGIASSSDVDRYLGRAAGSMMRDPWGEDDERSTFTDGDAPDMAPGAAQIWVASSAGPGPQTIRWEPRPGHWTLVVMNEDASAPVAAEVTVAAELPILHRLGVPVAVAGLLLFVASGVALIIAIPKSPSPAAA